MFVSYDRCELRANGDACGNSRNDLRETAQDTRDSHETRNRAILKREGRIILLGRLRSGYLLRPHYSSEATSDGLLRYDCNVF